MQTYAHSLAVVYYLGVITLVYDTDCEAVSGCCHHEGDQLCDVTAQHHTD